MNGQSGRPLAVIILAYICLVTQVISIRLIHTTTLQFEEFFDENVPRYAILTHRWGKEEVSYKEFLKGRAKGKAGLKKIKDFCSLAKSRKLDYAWIDTCCINKESSAELSEAINSMYRWYANSVECYVYLSDVSIVGSVSHDTWDEFRQSAWFTRGWTLQELLAPEWVSFYDRNWNFLGTKGSRYPWDARNDLNDEIAGATNIAKEYLDPENLQLACAAEKMSWISKRHTSRIEDMAYSLLGLFNINMPLIYGEGAKAFLRLQLEIIKFSDDESIFAWTSSDPGYHGLLAASPRDFANSSDVRQLASWMVPRPSYAMTNRGLQFHMVHYGAYEGESIHQVMRMPILCFKDSKGRRASGNMEYFAVIVVELSGIFESRFYRLHAHRVHVLTKDEILAPQYSRDIVVIQPGLT